ncbi:adenylyl-sulfate kinase [Nitrososphaera viennensis]|uniref:Adenylyl-sulfate kinase n=2 Tax=Nitrososphaera viennensis TaxID=1034015 RepID=A0A060HMS6_9ARCH|nr:adenylyl-sulfate kinase [Nitrososphaera viennensis]AIC16430.1 putative adenylyl-sulfate kinase [Nitrososphaera viennensis EN76]UVS68365.1 adenylyl-sulfate kinase [Nitrososphaera viennensis]
MVSERSTNSQFVVWLTGLPGSGKTTLGNNLLSKLKELDVRTELLDGDIVRKELSPELGFTKEDRELHARRVIYLSKLLSRNGIGSIVSLISPYRELRTFAKKEIGIGFVEVYVNCSLEICIERDPKGLYKKALEGKIQNLTGLQDPYEEPLSPDLIVYTAKETIEESTNKILVKLRESGFLDR